MNILRSPGLAAESGNQKYKAPQELHPKEEGQNLESTSRRLHYSAASFNFVTGQWFRKQIQRSKRGTTVDQWDWDNKVTWSPLTFDSELMDDMAETWALLVAMGYLRPRYREHLAGGRLVAFSMDPKPGVRPICIIGAIRSLLVKGLLECCKALFTYEFP